MQMHFVIENNKKKVILLYRMIKRDRKREKKGRGSNRKKIIRQNQGKKEIYRRLWKRNPGKKSLMCS